MAQRHPSSRRRSGESKAEEAEDLFVAKVLELSNWARANSLVLILFGLALALVLGGVLYYVNFRRSLEDQAIAQLEQIHQTVQVGDPATARAQLNQFIERFGGTPAAGEARLALAKLDLQQGQPEQAIQVLDRSDLTIDDPLGVQIETLKAKALEAAGRPQDAERAYLRVADAAELDFLRVNALADAARLRSSQGNPAGAAQLYQRILDELDPTSPDRSLYEMRLAEAQAAAEAAAG